MIYLASAYSHFDRTVIEERFQLAVRAAALALSDGYMVYSPIVHCHPIATAFNVRGDFEFWRDYNQHMIECSEEVWVLCDPQEAWKKSKGVQAELELAKAFNKPVHYMTIDWLNQSFRLS